MAVDIHHGYQFITPIVGESHYTDTLKKCYNDPNAHKKGKSVFVDVKLVMQDDNRSKKPTQIYPKANLAFSSYFIAFCLCDFTQDLHKLHRHF